MGACADLTIPVPHLCGSQETGLAGKLYEQKTSGMVCEEMKVPQAVAAWIAEVGGFNVPLPPPASLPSTPTDSEL